MNYNDIKNLNISKRGKKELLNALNKGGGSGAGVTIVKSKEELDKLNVPTGTIASVASGNSLLNIDEVNIIDQEYAGSLESEEELINYLNSIIPQLITIKGVEINITEEFYNTQCTLMIMIVTENHIELGGDSKESYMFVMTNFNNNITIGLQGNNELGEPIEFIVLAKSPDLDTQIEFNKEALIAINNYLNNRDLKILVAGDMLGADINSLKEFIKIKAKGGADNGAFIKKEKTFEKILEESDKKQLISRMEGIYNSMPKNMSELSNDVGFISAQTEIAREFKPNDISSVTITLIENTITNIECFNKKINLNFEENNTNKEFGLIYNTFDGGTIFTNDNIIIKGDSDENKGKYYIKFKKISENLPYIGERMFIQDSFEDVNWARLDHVSLNYDTDRIIATSNDLIKVYNDGNPVKLENFNGAAGRYFVDVFYKGKLNLILSKTPHYNGSGGIISNNLSNLYTSSKPTSGNTFKVKFYSLSGVYNIQKYFYTLGVADGVKKVKIIVDRTLMSDFRDYSILWLSSSVEEIEYDYRIHTIIADDVSKIFNMKRINCYVLQQLENGTRVSIKELTVPETLNKDIDYFDIEYFDKITFPSYIKNNMNMFPNSVSKIKEISVSCNLNNFSDSSFNKCSLEKIEGTYSKDGYMLLGNGVLRKIAVSYADKSVLETIEITSDIHTIFSYAFYNCTALKTLHLPTSIKNIGTYAFDGCNIQSVIIDDLLSFCKIDFSNSTANPLYNGHGKDGADLYIGETICEDLTIPDELTEIKKYAFYGAKSIKNINLNNVNTIGESSFSSIKTINSVLAFNVENIDTSPFGNSKITSIVFGKLKEVERLGAEIELVDFSKQTEIPVLKQTNTGIDKMIVPRNLYDEWKTKTKWEGVKMTPIDNPYQFMMGETHAVCEENTRWIDYASSPFKLSGFSISGDNVMYNGAIIQYNGVNVASGDVIINDEKYTLLATETE